WRMLANWSSRGRACTSSFDRGLDIYRQPTGRTGMRCDRQPGISRCGLDSQNQRRQKEKDQAHEMGPQRRKENGEAERAMGEQDIREYDSRRDLSWPVPLVSSSINKFVDAPACVRPHLS